MNCEEREPASKSDFLVHGLCSCKDRLSLTAMGGGAMRAGPRGGMRSLVQAT